jgi:hypothetical protein
MRAISPDGSPLAETTVEVTRRTRGTRGLDLHLAEIEGTFRIVARLDPIADEALVLRQFALGAAGQPASRILAGCRLLHALHAPNRLLLLAEHGEQQLASFDVRHVESPVPDSYLAALEQLDTVQQHTFVTVRAPEQISRREARELGHAHNLLTGQPSGGRWHDLSIGVRASDVDGYLTRVLAGPGLAVEQPSRLNLAHQVIDFNRRYTLKLRSFRILNGDEVRRQAVTADADEILTVRLAPDDDDSFEAVPGELQATG